MQKDPCGLAAHALSHLLLLCTFLQRLQAHSGSSSGQAADAASSTGPAAMPHTHQLGASSAASHSSGPCPSMCSASSTQSSHGSQQACSSFSQGSPGTHSPSGASAGAGASVGPSSSIGGMGTLNNSAPSASASGQEASPSAPTSVIPAASTAASLSSGPGASAGPLTAAAAFAAPLVAPAPSHAAGSVAATASELAWNVVSAALFVVPLLEGCYRLVGSLLALVGSRALDTAMHSQVQAAIMSQLVGLAKPGSSAAAGIAHDLVRESTLGVRPVWVSVFAHHARKRIRLRLFTLASKRASCVGLPNTDFWMNACAQAVYQGLNLWCNLILTRVAELKAGLAALSQPLLQLGGSTTTTSAAAATTAAAAAAASVSASVHAELGGIEALLPSTWQPQAVAAHLVTPEGLLTALWVTLAAALLGIASQWLKQGKQKQGSARPEPALAATGAQQGLLAWAGSALKPPHPELLASCCLSALLMRLCMVPLVPHCDIALVAELYRPAVGCLLVATTALACAAATRVGGSRSGSFLSSAKVTFWGSCSTP